MNTPRYDQAVHLAATHFLSDLPPKATAQEIFDALDSEKLPPGYELCDVIRLPQEDLREWIENLAQDFMEFAAHE
jgi:hypothetical protein